MEKFIEYLPFIYFGTISLIAIVITVYDKIAAKLLPRHRIPEAALITLSLLGGSVAMLITMLIIRHKTLHKKFMVGIPVIIGLQLGITVAVWLLTK